MNICSVILRHAAEKPDHPALIEGNRVMTFGALATAIRQYAGALAADGLDSEDLIALDLQDKSVHLLAFLGAAWLGVTTIALNRQAPPSANRDILDVFPPRLILTDAASRAYDGIETRHLDDKWQRRVEMSGTGAGATGR